MDKFILLGSILILFLVVNSQDNIRDIFMEGNIQIFKKIAEQLTGCYYSDKIVKWYKCVNNASDKFSTSLKTGISSETDQKPNSDQLNNQIYYQECCGTW